MKRKVFSVLTVLALCAGLVTAAFASSTSEASGDNELLSFLLISLGTGIIVALLVTIPMALSLKSVRAQRGARSYQREGSFKLTHKTERFLYRSVTKHKKETSKTDSR